MVVFNTQMHIITFLICLFELVFLVYQFVYYLSRPSDKKRKYYLILLYLLIQNNIISGLLPDKNMSMNLILQSILSYGVSFAMVMYIPYYFYKAFGLTKLKFHAYWGTFIFLLGPYLLCFAIPYAITGNLQTSVRLAMIIPFFYALTLLYFLILAIKAKNREYPNTKSKRELNGVFVGVVFFVLLPVMAFFKNELDLMLIPILHFNDGSQVVEVLITNSSLLVFTILFIRSTVQQSRSEYVRLQESERELQKLNSELMLKVKERTLELELANEARTNAFINLAHETKTPLTLIINYLNEYVRKTNQSSSEELRLLKSSIEHLRRDIVNFFDMEKIQKGIDMYDHTKISNISEILRDSIVLFEASAIPKNLLIQPQVQENLFVKGDPSSLYRIINNIMENSVKYTPENGTIKIDLSNYQDKIILVVRDTGIGIPKHLQEKIFEPYYQINSAKANFQGIGLGLSIVKDILSNIEGVIHINSSPDIMLGTEIRIELPAYHIKDNEEISQLKNNHIPIIFENERLTISEKPIEKGRPTILVVEDNKQFLNYTVTNLQKNYNVYFSLNGQEAVKKLDSIEKLDLIVSDVMMDNGDGYFLYDYVLNSKQLNHIPFVFLTAKNTLDDRIRGLAAGAIAYICKPFEIEELELKIKTLLKNLVTFRDEIITRAYQTIINNNELNEYSNRKAPQPTSFELNCYKYNLSVREIDVIKLLGQGKINKEIARDLFISIETVKTHVRNSYEKVGVNTRIELLKKLDV